LNNILFSVNIWMIKEDFFITKNINDKKLIIRILAIIAFMTLLEVKKLNIVNKKLTLSKSNHYSADGAVSLVSIALMTLLGVKK